MVRLKVHQLITRVLLLLLVSLWFSSPALAVEGVFQCRYPPGSGGLVPAWRANACDHLLGDILEDIFPSISASDYAITQIDNVSGSWSYYNYHFELDDSVASALPFTSEQAEEFRKLSQAIREFAIWTIQQGMKVYPVGILLGWFSSLTRRS